MQWTLEQARVHRGLSQESVAKKLNVSRQTYQNYESYRTTMQIPTGYRFSEIVGIPFDDIIFFKQNYTSSVQRPRKEHYAGNY